MLTLSKTIRWAVALAGRLHIAARLTVMADLDATISNVSPSTPICRGSPV